MSTETSEGPEKDPQCSSKCLRINNYTPIVNFLTAPPDQL